MALKCHFHVRKFGLNLSLPPEQAGKATTVLSKPSTLKPKSETQALNSVRNLTLPQEGRR